MVDYKWVLFYSTTSLISIPDFSHVYLYAIKQLLYRLTHLFNQVCFSVKLRLCIALIFDRGLHPGYKVSVFRSVDYSPPTAESPRSLLKAQFPGVNPRLLDQNILEAGEGICLLPFTSYWMMLTCTQNRNSKV